VPRAPLGFARGLVPVRCFRRERSQAAASSDARRRRRVSIKQGVDVVLGDAVLGARKQARVGIVRLFFRHLDRRERFRATEDLDHVGDAGFHVLERVDDLGDSLTREILEVARFEYPRNRGRDRFERPGLLGAGRV
jgi:hypothetical protein